MGLVLGKGVPVGGEWVLLLRFFLLARGEGGQRLSAVQIA